MYKVKKVEGKAQFSKAENSKSGVILLGVCFLNALHAWDQGLKPLFFEILWRGKKNKTLSLKYVYV